LNAIESNHLASALLFTGPRGVGKRLVLVFSQKKSINQGMITEDFAFNVFELDAASTILLMILGT
jgi:DNA polymerase-3 subunit gamma/tau